ncbi:MAG: DUF5677 domain-containing protein [candidate division Zixibacteria bacterium]
MYDLKNIQTMFLDLQNVVEESVSVSKQINGEEASERCWFIGRFITEQARTSVTIWTVINPQPRPDLACLDGKANVDISSAWVLLRSLYERLLQWQWVFCNDEFEHCPNIIIDIANIHSTREREKVSANLDDHKGVLEAVNLRQQMCDEIYEHEEFDDLPEDQKRYVESVGTGNWPPMKVIDLAKKCGFSRSQHDAIYAYASQHAHGRPRGLLQVATPSGAAMMMLGGMFYASGILSLSLDVCRKAIAAEGVTIQLSQKAEGIAAQFEEMMTTKLGDCKY